MVWIEIACFGRGVGVGWAWGGGWGVNRACNCVFSVSHLFQLSCPSWRVSSIVTARITAILNCRLVQIMKLYLKQNFSNVCQ